VVYDLIKRLLADSKELKLFGTGKQMRDFIHVDDLVDAMLLVADKGMSDGQSYNIASGKSYSIAEIASVICKEMHIVPQLHFSGESRPGEPEKWIADVSKITHLGFTPSVPLKSGIRQTISWIADNP
jgi:dTDP-glucose 4,6-dehydratase/UDP-glucose 4-epimerase